MKDKNKAVNLPQPAEHQEALLVPGETVERLEAHASASPDAPPIKPLSKKDQLLAWFEQHKKIVLMAGAGALLLAVVTLVFTDAKYLAMNLVTRADVTVTVVDGSTRQPVPEAAVTIGSSWAETNGEGSARLSGSPYGNVDVKVSKFAYGDTTQRAKITASGQSIEVALTPTGTPVSFKVINTITGEPLKGVKASFGSSDALSNEQGLVTLSIPPQQTKEVEVKLSRDGMTTRRMQVPLKAGSVNDVNLTPGGKIYFLSKRTGKIDVMKSNLDGSDPSVVLAGTGKEDNFQTVLLASRDWKYLALKSKRDGAEKLYLIDTYNDSLSIIDEGKASFYPAGWNGHSFIFRVYRSDVQAWQAKGSALKSFNAETKQMATLDETRGEGSSNLWWRHQLFGLPYIVKDGIVYTKEWSGTMSRDDVQNEIIFVGVNGGQKKTLHSFKWSESNGLNTRLYAVDEIYFLNYKNAATEYFEYEDGTIKEAKLSDDEFNGTFYATPLLSPSGNATLWYEPRDGKNTLLVGDAEGKNGKEIVSLGEYVAYGWYSDSYILVSKSDSELYIMPKSGPGKNGPLKITDYHKPQFDGRGYGYGYGGF